MLKQCKESLCRKEESMTQNLILLKKCLKEIESKINWVDSSQWQQNHFESLSELIYEKTKVNLSPLTLKRLWGKTKYDSNPSINTLDTLVKFLDYEDWIDYQCNQNRKIVDLKYNYLKNKKVVVAASIIFGILLLTISIIKLMPYSSAKDYSNFEFSVRKLSSSLPNTVYFKYNAKNSDADSVIIQQSWDPKLHHLVDKNKTDFSCIYYYPGYYKAKLVLDKEVVSEQDLYIKTNGWLGIIQKEPVPYYLTAEKIVDSNIISIKEKDLIEAGFDLKNEIPITTINLVEEIDSVEGNNFELQASFKQTYSQGEAICQKTALIILCSNGYFHIPFSIKGCVNELRMYIPDKQISAKDRDLGNLGIVDSNIIDLDLKVTQGIFDLAINSISAFQDTLTTNPGKIVGVKFGFHGTGEVYSFKLSSEDKIFTMSDFMP